MSDDTHGDIWRELYGNVPKTGQEWIDALEESIAYRDKWVEEHPDAKWSLPDCPFDLHVHEPCESREVDDTPMMIMTIAPTRWHWLSLKLLRFALWLGAYVGVADG